MRDGEWDEGVRMSVCSIAQAKDHLSKLIDEALAGEEVTITRHGKPVAELRPARAAGAGRLVVRS